MSFVAMLLIIGFFMFLGSQLGVENERRRIATEVRRQVRGHPTIGVEKLGRIVRHSSLADMEY